MTESLYEAVVTGLGGYVNYEPWSNGRYFFNLHATTFKMYLSGDRLYVEHTKTRSHVHVVINSPDMLDDLKARVWSIS